MVKRKICTLLVATVLAMPIVPPAAQATPCGSVLCLGGLVTGGLGGPACVAQTADFFAIQVWDPYFDPIATSSAREAFLYSCPDVENDAIKPAIIAAFGSALDVPFFGP
jgi:hypothetical protein